MEKRYQVFASSTYADLKDERQNVLQTLMEMDCIPAGMELFPAADEEQWEFIKKIIDDCDYYLLIIGGRYGSITAEGISYTEKEFDYAVEKGLKIVALVHEDPDGIAFDKSEKDPELREKLIKFKNKVTNGRLVKFWKKAEDLPGFVSHSLIKTIKMYPATGWVRADNIANEDILIETNALRKENASLASKLAELEPKQNPDIQGIADFNSKFTIHGSLSKENTTEQLPFKLSISWKELFTLISPNLIEKIRHKSFKKLIEKCIKEEKHFLLNIRDDDFTKIVIQLKAYGLITKKIKYNNSFWFLTKTGEKLMIETTIIRENHTQ